MNKYEFQPHMMSDDIYSNYDVIVSPKSEENKDKQATGFGGRRRNEREKQKLHQVPQSR